ELAAGLVDRGYAIVSGAAYGVDGAAHRAALASRGTTVAFLAGGLDRFYPSGNEALITRVTDRGAAISEVPCGVAPTKWRFLQRNRLIAAASIATVVVEAGARSGSLNTAGHAAAVGRPLGAVPGPITSSASAGCHRLLREYDAVCVTTADEIAELAPLPEPLGSIADGADAGTVHYDPSTVEEAEARGRRPAADPTGTRIRLLDALSARSPRSVDKVAALSGLAADRVRAELGLLSLEGAVRERAGGWVRASWTGLRRHAALAWKPQAAGGRDACTPRRIRGRRGLQHDRRWIPAVPTAGTRVRRGHRARPRRRTHGDQRRSGRGIVRTSASRRHPRRALRLHARTATCKPRHRDRRDRRVTAVPRRSRRRRHGHLLSAPVGRPRRRAP